MIWEHSSWYGLQSGLHNTVQERFQAIQKQRKDLSKLKTILELLVAGGSLPEKYKDHPLYGNYEGTRDCHITPDWVLIYVTVGDELRLIRTGSHSELFE